MFRFETDNAEIEALFLGFLKKMLTGEEAVKREPVKLAPLPQEPVQEFWEPAAPRITKPAPTMAQLSIPDQPKTERRKVERRGPDGFPESWKRKALDKISARQAFTTSEITGGKHQPEPARLLKEWLLKNDKVSVERLVHKPGHPFLFTPTWENNKGETQFAANRLLYLGQVSVK